MNYSFRNLPENEDSEFVFLTRSKQNTLSGLIRVPAMGFLPTIRWCGSCIARRRQRRALMSLDERLLRDIGITRRAAEIEAAKPFWK